MKPYFQDEMSTIYHGDAREILPSLEFSAIVTDPVWPNCVVPLPGHERAESQFGEILAAAGVRKRLAVHLGVDTYPRFMRAVPEYWPFFRVCWLEVAIMPMRSEPLETYEPKIFTPAEPTHAD